MYQLTRHHTSNKYFFLITSTITTATSNQLTSNKNVSNFTNKARTTNFLNLTHTEKAHSTTLSPNTHVISTHPRAWTSRLQSDTGRRSRLSWWRRDMSLLAITCRTRCRWCCLRWLRYMISRQWFWNCLQCRTHRCWHSLTGDVSIVEDLCLDWFFLWLFGMNFLRELKWDKKCSLIE